MKPNQIYRKFLSGVNCLLNNRTILHEIKCNKFHQNLFALFFIISLCVCKSHAQIESKSKVDSLKIEIKNIKDEKLKVQPLLELATFCLDVNISESIKYTDEAFKIINEYNLKAQLGAYWFVKAKEFLLLSETTKALNMIKKAQSSFLEEKNYKKYLASVVTESKIHLYSDNIEESKNVLKRSLIKYGKSKFQFEIASIYVMLGVCESSHTKLIHAISCFEKALNIYKKINDKKGIYDCYSMISQFHISTQTYDKALKYAKLASDDNDIKKNNLALASERLTYAMIYFYTKNYSKASTEIEKSISLSKDTGNILLYNKIARFYVKINAQIENNNELISFCKENLKSYDKSADVNLIFYYGLSTSYLSKKEYTLAKKYNNIILNLLKMEDPRIIEIINFDLDLYSLFAKTEYALKNYEKAYTYQKEYTKLINEFATKQNLAKVLELQEAFDSNQKDVKLKDLTIFQQKQKLEILKEKSFNFKLLSVIVCVLVALSILFFAFYSNRKKNKLLNAQNEIISDKIIMVEEQKVKISQALFERELLLKEIHHRVKNNLQIIMSLLNIQAKEGDKTNIEDFLEKGQSRINSMALIHQSLYENDKLDNIDLNEYLLKLVGDLKQILNTQNTNLTFKIEAKNIFLDIQTAIPLGLILNELLSNAFKHAFNSIEEGEINIIIQNVDDGFYELKFSDNGNGFPEESNCKKSLGLELVTLLVKQLKGKITKQIGNGTAYIIIFKEVLN